MAVSALGQLILYLHSRALVEGRLHEDDATASQIIAVLSDEQWQPEGKFRDLPLGVQVGLELRSGRAFSDEARNIRQAALARLRDYELLVAAIDELGYLPQLIRAALSLHYEQLEEEPLGSDGNCILIDLQAARAKAPEEVQHVVDLLPSMGPQSIGEELDTNGSRLVGRSMALLNRILEGKYIGKPRKRRRRKAKRDAKNTTTQ